MITYTRADQKQIHLIKTSAWWGIFHSLVEKGISKIIWKGENVVIFINKKGVHSGMVCQNCGYIPYCKQCDIPISLHNNVHDQLFGLCTVCQTCYTTFDSCPECQIGKMGWYGVGIQQVAKYCKEVFWSEPIMVQSSDANSLPKTQELLKKLRISNWELRIGKIILSTSLMQTPMVANIGLVVFQNALHIGMPDYNAEFQNFHMLHQIISSFPCPHFMLQTSNPDHIILTGLSGSAGKDVFLEHDTLFRIKHNYPPHGELCILSYKHELESKLFSKVHTLFHDILALKQWWWKEYADIEVFALPANVYKMFNKYRYQIIIKWPTIRPFCDSIMTTLSPFAKGFKFDRGAQSFL